MSWVQELEIWSGQNAQNCFLYQIRCPHQSIFRSGIDFSASQDLHLSALKIADIFLTKWYNKNTILAPSFNIVLVSFECKGQFLCSFVRFDLNLKATSTQICKAGFSCDKRHLLLQVDSPLISQDHKKSRLIYQVKFQKSSPCISPQLICLLAVLEGNS